MLRERRFDFSVTCVILGGGAGTRLYPLTHRRAKPAVPLGGKFRLIDVPVSNCLNSGYNRIYVLTQFNSTSLHRHISQSYHFDRFGRGFIEILAAQQTPEHQDAVDRSWYQGTADAVRKNLARFREAGGSDVLVLSGDQIYQMDYRDVIATHRGERGGGPADVTIAGLLVSKDRVGAFGIMQTDDAGRVLAFVEKPKTEERLHGLEAPPELVARCGFSEETSPLYLANMGIYAFRREVLEEALDNDFCDFGKEVLPNLLSAHRVRAHLFSGYWEDIGTIRTFHRANIELAGPTPRFHFYLEDAPVYSRARLLPPTRLEDAKLRYALIADGCLIDAASIERSVIGLRSVVGRGCTIRNTYIMGADYYETEESKAEARRRGEPIVGIGEGTRIENAIVDKNARIGRNVSIVNGEGHTTYEDGCVVIREGIVVVPRGGVVPDGYAI
ncbi:MAG: glucose-1-phosphate adenylyltransferase [Planctomycetota bacterium]